MQGAAEHVAVALGSNLGDRRAHLAYAIARLSRLLGDVRVSRLVETAPHGIPAGGPPHPAYLNAALVGTWIGTPEALLASLLALEAERGRERPHPLAPRTLDLDLILFGARILNRPELTVPHPRFRERAFVLEPLAEIAPDLVDPVTGKAVGALWQALRDAPIRT